MERRNVSFPPETLDQLADLAPRFGNNRSEANRVAIERLHQLYFEPEALTDITLLEQLEILHQEALVLIHERRAQPALQRPLAELPEPVRVALAAMAVQDAARDGVEQADAERRLLTALIMNERDRRLRSEPS